MRIIQGEGHYRTGLYRAVVVVVRASVLINPVTEAHTETVGQARAFVWINPVTAADREGRRGQSLCMD